MFSAERSSSSSYAGKPNGGETKSAAGSPSVLLEPRLRIALVIFICAALLLALSGVAIYKIGSVRMRAQTRVVTQLDILLQLDDFASSLKQAESAVRGYLLTGDSSFIGQFSTATTALTNSYSKLNGFVDSDHLRESDINELQRLAQLRLDNLNETLRTRREEATRNETAKIATSQKTMANFDAAYNRIREREHEKFVLADERVDETSNVRLVAYIVGCVLNLAFLSWGLRRVSTEIRRQHQTACDMARLQAIGARCTRAGNHVDQCLSDMLEAAMVLAKSDKGLLCFLSAGQMKIAAQRGFDSSSAALFGSLGQSESSVCGVPLERDRHVGVDDVAQSKVLKDSPWRQALLDAGVQALLATPLTSSSGRMLGVFATLFSRPHRPNERELLSLDLLARQGADYLERKQIEEQLQKAHKQLADRAVHLEELVQERTARLNETITDLEALSYSIIHDLRAPLRAMQGFAELLKEQCHRISPEAHDYTDRITIAASRMDRLIQDALAYSRVAQSEFPVKTIDLNLFLNGLIRTYPELEEWRDNIHVAPDLPHINANEAALTQCVANLLRNGVKFVQPGVTPDIHIWAERRDNNVFLFFKDNGIGIDPASQTKIFQIFQRLGHGTDGTGMGLAIVKKAIERMGGHVGVESRPGHGSTFWLELQPAPQVGKNVEERFSRVRK